MSLLRCLRPLLRIAVLIAAIASTGKLAAQDTATVHPGDDVRVKATFMGGRFRVASITPEEITLLRSANSTPDVVPIRSLTSLYVARGNSTRASGMKRGAVKGFVIGSVAGIILAAQAAGSSGGLTWEPGEAIVFGVVVFGGGGAVIGLVVGSVLPTTNWERVPLESLRGATNPSPSRLGISIRF
jgi:hypothetical protein